MKTSSTVKNRYNKKAYDFINLAIPKGNKEKLKIALGDDDTLNGFLNRIIKKTIQDNEEYIECIKNRMEELNNA